MNDVKKYLTLNNVLYVCLMISLAATLGSLYFSEVLRLPPCDLCWYQRVFMYPLVLIFTVAIIKRDPKVYNYVLPVALIGTAYAFYHVLLQEGIINEDITKCISGVPCTDESNVIYGIITIPLMSLLSFLTIDVLMLYLKYFKVDHLTNGTNTKPE
jgi:disulfide bond formation protein DsbB